MNESKEFDEFVYQMIENRLAEYRKTEEHRYQQKCRERADELIEDCFDQSDKTLIEEILFEFGGYSDRQSELLYKQGMRDCVSILKNLGVLA